MTRKAINQYHAYRKAVDAMAAFVGEGVVDPKVIPEIRKNNSPLDNDEWNNPINYAVKMFANHIVRYRSSLRSPRKQGLILRTKNATTILAAKALQSTFPASASKIVWTFDDIGDRFHRSAGSVFEVKLPLL